MVTTYSLHEGPSTAHSIRGPAASEAFRHCARDPRNAHNVAPTSRNSVHVRMSEVVQPLSAPVFGLLMVRPQRRVVRRCNGRVRPAEACGRHLASVPA